MYKYPNQKWTVLIDTQSNKHPARLLRPQEFELILEGCKISGSDKTTLINQLRLKTALITGMRYGELCRLTKHPEYYDKNSNVIFLPNETKKFRTARRRYIRLPDIARDILPMFFKVVKDMPSIQAWIQNLKRWAIAGGLDPNYLCARTTRKTWESWLVATGHDTLMVALSQGHNEDTMLKHYLGIPFSDEDKIKMQYWVRGWK